MSHSHCVGCTVTIAIALEIFVLGFCSILMSHIQFITAYDASVLPGSSVEAERGIFDYYAVMRRIESCDLYMTVAIRGSVCLFVCLFV